MRAQAARRARADAGFTLAEAAIPVDLPTRAVQRVRVAAQLRAEWMASRALPSGTGDYLDDRDDPAAEAAFRAAHPLAARLAALAPAANATPASPLGELALIFGLAEAEVDIVDCLLALDVEPSLAPVFAALNRHGRGIVTLEVVARLFGHGRTLILTEHSPLSVWDIVTAREIAPDEPASLVIDPAILAHLLGRREIEPLLAGAVHDGPPHPPLPNWPVAQVSGILAARLAQHDGQGVRLVVRGVRGSGRTTFARAALAKLGLPLLVLDADAVDTAAWPRLFLLAQRRAFLARSALAWRGTRLAERPWRAAHPVFPFEIMVAEPGQPLPRAHRGTSDNDIDVTLPAADVDERRALWLVHVPSASAWPAGDLDRLASSFHVTAGDIGAIGRRAPKDAAACIAALRVELPEALREYAELPECPFGWDDLVCGDGLRAGLETFAFEAEARSLLWREPEARRLFPQGRALVGLFFGPSGTGKTMAAQVVAADRGLTLCRVNLAMITSKWVGETSQRIESLFRFASGRNMILLIDEADALCGKRIEETGDAQDAHVNRDISHLMMAIESHDGVVILTTNLKANIDGAFLRRVRHVIEFRKPAAEERLAIWRKLIGGMCGDETLARLGPRLARFAGIEATGAQVKNAVLSARFGALRERCPVEMTHLIAGLDREFRKEGYSLSPHEREGAMHG